MGNKFVNISTRVPIAMKEGLDKLAKEYNVTRSEMLRILIAEVVEDDTEAETRTYRRRQR